MRGKRFLFEASQLEELQKLCEVNLVASMTLDDAGVSLDMKAFTLAHLAQLHETLGRADKAIELNHEGLQLRLNEKPPQTDLIACFQNNLGVAYSTANDHDNALTWLEKARSTWSEAYMQQGRPPCEDSEVMVDLGRCLFFLERPEEARRQVDDAIENMRQTGRLWGALAQYVSSCTNFVNGSS